MALLQITEPNANTAPHKHNYALGIDLGTTNSLVATIKNGSVQVLTDSHGKTLIPSVVNYNQETSVGNSALSLRSQDSENTLYSMKRLLGKSFADIAVNSNLPYHFVNQERSSIYIQTRQGVKTPVQVAADILQYLKQLALDSLGEEIVGAVVTVPAYFDEGKRQATKQACTLAGIKVLRLLNEPTAAAIAYGLEQQASGKFLVFDLGGGTLDISILTLKDNVFEVLAVNGNPTLGGDDFDQILFNYLQNKYRLINLDKNNYSKLLELTIQLKHQLSTNNTATAKFEFNGADLALEVNLNEFNQLVRPLVNQAITPLKKALRDCRLNYKDISQVILVGGATRMSIIKEELTKLFDHKILNSLNPDEVVAIGAALQANLLAGNTKQDWLLLDVTPLSLGIETMGGIVEKIIPRNSTIPCASAQDFTTYQDGQAAMSIHVVQGERELVDDCRSLAKFSLKGIPPLAQGQAKIRITFQIDADGLLTVSAEELSTQIRQSIEVKPSYGLNSDEIATMLEESTKNAITDQLKRQYQELVVEAKSLLSLVKGALAQESDLLNQKQLAEIKQLWHNLDCALQDKITDYNQAINLLKTLIAGLNQLTTEFAHLRMERSINRALKGQKIS